MINTDYRIAFQQVLEDSNSWKTSQKHLQIRRISPEVCTKLSITPTAYGWRYPVANNNVSERWKAYDSDNKVKYQWIPKKEDDIDFYFHPDLRISIAENGQECWFVSGEADVWAMHSSNIPNVFSGFTESTVSPKLIQFLTDNGVVKLLLAPDKDETGRKWAAKVKIALAESQIDLEIYELPDSLGEKGDIGKAWANFNSSGSFDLYLRSLPKLFIDDYHRQILTVHKKILETPPINYKIPFEYKELIINSLNVPGFTDEGFCNEIYCPFHNDANPSASLHHEKGLYCHTEAKWYRWTEIGKALGIGSLHEFRIQKAIQTDDYPIQLSHESRYELLQGDMKNYARFLDALYLSGLIPGEIFSCSDAVARLKQFKISRNTINALLFPDEKRCKKEILNLLEKFPLFNLHLLKGEKNPTNSSKLGRRAKEFRLPYPQEICDFLSLPFSVQFEQLPIECLASVRLYRGRVYRDYIAYNPGIYSRKVLGDKIGVCARTTRSYDKLQGIVVEPRYKIEQLFIADIGVLPVERVDLPFWVWLEDEFGKRFRPSQGTAKWMLQQGKIVYLVKQLSSIYSVAKIE